MVRRPLAVLGTVGRAGCMDIWPRASNSLDMFSAGTFLGLVVLEGRDRVDASSVDFAARLKLGDHPESVIPAKAGIQGNGCAVPLDPCFRGGDGSSGAQRCWRPSPLNPRAIYTV